MKADSPDIGFISKLKLQWFLLLRAIIHWWVKAKILPQPFDDLEMSDLPSGRGVIVRWCHYESNVRRAIEKV